MVIIDSINGYLNAMPEARYLNLQLHELLAYLNQQGVVTSMSYRRFKLTETGLAPATVATFATVQGNDTSLRGV